MTLNIAIAIVLKYSIYVESLSTSKKLSFVSLSKVVDTTVVKSSFLITRKTFSILNNKLSQINHLKKLSKHKTLSDARNCQQIVINI